MFGDSFENEEPDFLVSSRVKIFNLDNWPVVLDEMFFWLDKGPGVNDERDRYLFEDLTGKIEAVVPVAQGCEYGSVHRLKKDI